MKGHHYGAQIRLVGSVFLSFSVSRLIKSNTSLQLVTHLHEENFLSFKGNIPFLNRKRLPAVFFQDNGGVTAGITNLTLGLVAFDSKGGEIG